MNPTGGVIDDLPVYNFDQTDSTIFGGSVHLSYDTNIDWLSFDTSIEYMNGETSDGDYLPMIAPLTLVARICLTLKTPSTKLCLH